MRSTCKKLFALPVLVFFILAMASFSVVSSYASSVNGGIGSNSGIKNISADEAARVLNSTDAVVVDLRSPYMHELFNVSASDDESGNVELGAFIQQLLSGQYEGMPVVGIIDEASGGFVRDVLSYFEDMLGGLDVSLLELTPKNAASFEGQLNTFENIPLSEVEKYYSVVKYVAQAGSVADAQAQLEAVNQAIASGTFSQATLDGLDAALSALIEANPGCQGPVLAAIASTNDLNAALGGLSTALAKCAPTPTPTPTPTPAPTPTPTPMPTPMPTPVPPVVEEVPPVVEEVPPAPTPVPGEEVVPPVPAPTPAPAPTPTPTPTPVPVVPGVANECVNAVLAIVSKYPDLEEYNINAMVSDVVSQSAVDDCLLYDLVLKVNDRVGLIYSDMVSTGLFSNLLHRRDIINYDTALDDGLREAALADGRITDRQATVDEKLDKLYRKKDARHRIPLGSWLPTWFTTYPRDIMIRVLRGRENPLDAIGNALNDPWTNGINFETKSRGRK